MDLKMAWRNVWRNPRRTWLTVAAIAFAALLLVFMLSFQFGSYAAMINAAVKVHTGHLQVQAEGYQEDRDMRLVVPDPEAVGHILGDIDAVQAHTFRANGFSLASSQDRTYGVMVIGIDPEREAAVTTIDQVVRKGEYLAAGDVDQALVGRLLARNLNVVPGDEITILGQGRDGSIAATVLVVKGVFQSGQDEFDRSAVMMPLSYFQDVYAMRGAVHEVVVLGRSLDEVDSIEDRLQTALDGLDADRPLAALNWRELMPGLLQGIKVDMISGFIFYFLLILVVAFSILNTFLMAVLERTREFGVMLAIGVRPGRLTRLLIYESTALTLIGILAGVALGSLLTWYFQVHGLDLGGSSAILEQFGISGRLYPKLSWLSASIGPAMVLVITALAALYPALKVRRLEPVEALNHV
jgi:ABC-type lipoprotein release transport system permease subunit